MSAYEPELGQMFFGQPTEQFALPPFVLSMFDGLMDQCRRVHWNKHQTEYEDYNDADLGGIHLRHYSWTHGDEDAGPNFWVDDTEQKLRWYKHPGRGMSCSILFSPSQWIEWHDKVMAEIIKLDQMK